MHTTKSGTGTKQIPESIQLIVLGPVSEYDELVHLKQQISTISSNIKLRLIQEPQGSLLQISSLLASLPSQSIILVLPQTLQMVSNNTFKTISNQNNIVFYIHLPDKESKGVKVATRWQLYKLILKKVPPKLWIEPDMIKDRKISRIIPVCVRVLKSQNLQFNSMFSALAIKYSSKQTIDFSLIQNIKYLLDGRHEKRILIVHNRQGDYAKHYLTEVMASNQKIYSILFEGTKISEYNFNTSSVGDVQHLLDSLSVKYSRKKQSHARIKMKSIKKVDENKRGPKAKILVIESQNEKFNDLFLQIEGAYVIKEITQQHMVENIDVVVNYSQCAKHIAHVGEKHGLNFFVYADPLLPHQIFKHPSVAMITDNPQDIIRFIRAKEGNIDNNTSFFNKSNFVSETRIQMGITSLPPHLSLASSKLLTKSRGTFPNGVKFMQWDIRFVKNSNGAFYTYPQDEPQKYKSYCDSMVIQLETQYMPFKTFGQLRSPTGIFQKSITNLFVAPQVYEQNKDQCLINSKNSISIIQQLIPVTSTSQNKQNYQLKFQKGSRSSGLSSQKISSQAPRIPLQSQLFTQTKESKQLSQSFQNMYIQNYNDTQMNSKLIFKKQRQSSIQSQSKTAFQPSKHRFKSQNINLMFKVSQQNLQLDSFLTNQNSSDEKIKDFSHKNLMIIQQQQHFIPIRSVLKQSKSLQTDEWLVNKNMKSSSSKISRSNINVQIFPDSTHSLVEKQNYQTNHQVQHIKNNKVQQNLGYNKYFQQQRIQLIVKNGFRYINPQLHANTIFELYQFQTHSQLRYLTLNMNPQFRIVLITDQVPECINLFDSYPYFQCFIIPGNKLFQNQKMKYPQFKWICKQDKQLIAETISRCINYQSSKSLRSNRYYQTLTILYFYDQIELQESIINVFGNTVQLERYHSLASLFCHIAKYPIAVIVSLQFESAINDIIRRNPQANILIYSKINRVAQVNKFRQIYHQKQQVIKWIKSIKEQML